MTEPRNTLELIATRDIQKDNPKLSEEAVAERVQWLVGKGNAIGLDGEGKLAIWDAESCRLAGLRVKGTETIVDNRTPREKRDARIRETQKILSDRYAASRKPKERPDISKEFNQLVSEDPSLQGEKGKPGRAKLRETLLLAAGVAVNS